MRARVFSDHPRSTLEAVKLLAQYFSTDGEKIAIHAKAIRRACRLLKVMATCEDDARVTWRRSKEWRSRLELAGIDPDTFEISDEERFNLAWQQLNRTWTFRDDKAHHAIALGETAPTAEPLVKARAFIDHSKKSEPNPITDYLSPEKRRALLGRNKKK